MILDKKLFIYLSLAFIIATIIGTISHEFGHYIIARYLGYDASINYASTSWRIRSVNQVKSVSDSFWITIGGTLQTILTGTTGVVLLLIHKNHFFSAKRLSIRQWIIIFISLFWLRQTINLILGLLSYLFQQRTSSRGDEIELAKYLNMPDWSIVIVTGIIGATILGIVVFRFIPIHQRFTFLLAGLIGGAIGYFFWIELFGKLIMP